MAIGPLIRDLRLARGWSQGRLARDLGEIAERDSITREDISRWERGRVIPGPYWLTHLSDVFGVSEDALNEEARLSRVDRRSFMGLAALTAVHGAAASEAVAAITGGDPGLLATGQTSHGTDLVIASMMDAGGTRRLRRWMTEAADEVVRVNAAGVLAKMPGIDTAMVVARTLADDEATRHRYLTAVVARSCAMEWSTAAELAREPRAIRPELARLVANRLTGEVVNPRDSGARWCSATLLRELSPLLG